MEFIRTLWRGEYSLPRTYWLYGVLAGIILQIPIILAVDVYPAFAMSPAGSMAVFVYSLLFLAYIVVVLVGTWRSASKYQGSTVWAILAKIVVVFGWFQVLIAIAAMFGVNIQGA